MHDSLEQSGVIQHLIRERSVEGVVVSNANHSNGAGSGINDLNGACT